MKSDKLLTVSCTSIGHKNSDDYCNSCHNDEIDEYDTLLYDWFEGPSRKGLHKICIDYCCKFPVSEVTRKQVADAIRRVYRS